MKIFNFFKCGLFALGALFAGSSIACAQKEEKRQPEISVVEEVTGKYYHFKFTLTPENSELPPQDFSEHSGDFYVFIDKAAFPVRAPERCSRIVLRMPLTFNAAYKTALEGIASKRNIYEQIKKMQETGAGSVAAIVGLNPNFIVKSENPLRVELTGCDVFFRDDNGKYIDYLGERQFAR